VLATPTPTATVQTTTAPSSQTTTDGLPAQSQVSSAPSSTAQTDAKGTQTTTSATPTQKETPKFGIKTIPLALSLELFSKPFAQPNAFPDLNIGQELPNDIKMLQQTYMDLITNGSLFNPDQSEKLRSIAADAVELEQ
jgi:hypothetical protein